MGTVRFFRHSTRLFRYYIPTEYIILAMIEFCLLIAALWLAIETRYYFHHTEINYAEYPLKGLLFATIMQLSLVAFGVYQRQSGRFADVLMLRIASGLLLGLIPLSLSFYFAPMFFLGRGVMAISVVYSFLMISLLRLYFRRVVKERNMWSRVLILGSGNNAELIRKAKQEGELKGLNIVGFIHLEGDLNSSEDAIELDIPLVEYVRRHDVDEIVLAIDDRRKAGIPATDLLDCKMSGIDILEMVSFFERRTGKIRLDVLHPSWLYLSDGFHESTFRSLSKRVFDILIVLCLMPLAFPLMILTALAVLLESPRAGSVLYSQVRVAQDGRPFNIYKFRSMVVDAEKDGVAQYAQKNDARITRVGRIIRKLRFDELPQLFNVLRGDMSFVGPRPERPQFVERLAETVPYYRERHRVKPGLTGWAQIRYPYGDTDLDAHEKLQYDLYYVKNFSIFLDLLILLQTAEVVMLGKGAR